MAGSGLSHWLAAESSGELADSLIAGRDEKVRVSCSRPNQLIETRRRSQQTSPGPIAVQMHLRVCGIALDREYHLAEGEKHVLPGRNALPGHVGKNSLSNRPALVAYLRGDDVKRLHWEIVFAVVRAHRHQQAARITHFARS